MKEKDYINLLAWYLRVKRDLPWRHTHDSYAIWISEIMLQQTRVETVMDYYRAFMYQLPTIKDLANVPEDQLLKLWEGLGYYSRARNLQKTAKIIVNNGLNELPHTKDELLDLPGIGPYTAGAILSIAYHQNEPAIDGNVMRVLSRVYEEKRDIKDVKVRLHYERKLKKYMAPSQTSDFTQSFIELGALVCIPHGEPLCDDCPLQNCCLAHLHHHEMLYPKKTIKQPRRIEERTVFLLHCKNKYAIQKRDSKGLLANLYEFPNILQYVDVKEIYPHQTITELGNFKHIFSHIEWHMKAYQIELDTLDSKYIWVNEDELEGHYSLPTAFKKIYYHRKDN